MKHYGSRSDSSDVQKCLSRLYSFFFFPLLSNNLMPEALAGL